MPVRFHLFRHGGVGAGDSLDVLLCERDALERLMAEWTATRPGLHAPGTAVITKWDHGTFGKLLLEHGAVCLAAEADVAEALARAGQHAAAEELRREADELRSIVNQMNRASRGVQPMSLAISPDFDDAVGRLGEQMAAGALRPAVVVELGTAVEPFRAELHTARYIRSHAPTHSAGPHHHPLLGRLHTAHDRLRGMPWAESPSADRTVTRHYDQERPMP